MKYGGKYTYRRYSNLKKYIKGLHNVAYKLWKEICYKRDGEFCHIQRYYPQIEVPHSNIIQVDHCFSRGNKHLFYDVWNGLPICGNCNGAKSNQMKSVHRAIDEMVEKRNPEWFKKAKALDQRKSANPNFNKVWWLEEKIDELKEIEQKLEGANSTHKATPPKLKEV
jgi:hypothetical protein